MKKAISLILALAMALALCACGGQSGGAEKQLQFGTVDGSRYENSFLGIGCELDGWTYASQEELAQVAGLTADMFSEDFAQKMENVEMYYDMMAVAPDGLGSINIVIQNIGLVYSLAASEEQIIASALTSLDSELAAAGFSNVTAEQNKVTFAGAEHAGLQLTANYMGVDVYEQQVYIKVGRYVAVVTLASYMTDATAGYADYFFALD